MSYVVLSMVSLIWGKLGDVSAHSIQRNSAVALHEQIRIILGNEIEAGAYGDGRLPSEAELTTRFGVSRISLRRALSDLEAQGLVSRVQGKGTFAHTPPLASATMSMGSYADQVLVSGLPTSEIKREIKFAGIVPAKGTIARLMQVPEEDDVIRLTRVFSLRGTPLSVDDAYYAPERYPGFLAKVTNETSTYALLTEEYGVKFGSTDRFFDVTFIDPTTARWLDRPERDPVLKISKVAYDTAGEVVHVSRLLTVPTRLEVGVHLNA